MNPSHPAVEAALSRLTIDLGAVRRNYRRLLDRLGGVPCAGVVKADGYGLGADRVAPALWAEGCRIFFVATLEEAVRLRPAVPEATVCCLNGLLPGTEAVFAEYRLVPVLNAVDQIGLWRDFGARSGRALPAILHVDTGMNRLGLGDDEWSRVLETPDALAGVDWLYLISHLASADEPADPMNARQLARFKQVRKALPTPMKACLANSSGVFLGADYHFDLARPGIALYGGRPNADGPNPMECPIRIEGRILQVRTVPAGATVGYATSWTSPRASQIATVAAGYADGYLRSLSGVGVVALGGRTCPVVGRVSMDLITVDVTDVPPVEAVPGAFVEVLGPAVTPDAAADAAGTIGYELLTSLGRRYVRHYVGTGQ
ncbi:alanine racemase [Thalassobaculum fulvum]|uniref:Alanine racemase n=1 Tax=Thalassobaculum fulvum TaxID=1633335 RepID=A0A919CQR1_9PROT|nr:alanine racemase [Thalassobaculum fulvum]GHD49743.1 alanine racemase [Thalassobaculum fulvum]